MPADFWTEPGPSAAALRRAHGDVFQLTTTPTQEPFNCVTGVEAHKAFLIDNLERLSYFDPIIRMGFMPQATAGGLISMDSGEEHRWFRKVLTPCFSSAAITARLPVIHEVVSRRLSTWPSDGRIDLYREVSELAFHITAVFVLGTKASDDVTGLHDHFRDLIRNKPGVAALVAKEFAPLIIARHKQPADDALSALIRAGGPNGPVTPKQILGHVNTLMVAGHYTTAGLGSYLLTLLVSHPDELAQVLEEQLAVEGTDMQALARLERLDNALMEAERLMPPVPHLMRRALEDIEIQGHVFHPGEFLFCSVAGTHRDPDIFADPDTFTPCRFAPPRSERRGQPLALAGFSLGARRCLGALLAQVSIKVIVNRVLRGFTLTAEQDKYPTVYRPVLRPIGPMPFHTKART
jgi:cytochrome P450